MINHSFSSNIPTFHNMFIVVHIDEKLFYMSRPTQRYYLVSNEDEPQKTSKSKKVYHKRLRFDTSRNEVISRKIGIFSLTRTKWPQVHTYPIFIQQNNAKPHVDVNDSEFLTPIWV